MSTTPAEASQAKRNNSSSLRRALALMTFIAEAVQSGTHPSLPDLAAGTGLPKSTLKRLLDPLVDSGLIRHDAPSGRYGLGPYTATLGGIYLNGLDIRDTVRPVLEELTRSAQETSHLLVLADVDVVCIDKVDSPNPVRMHSWIGNRLPLYCTAGGKALLAHQPDDAVERVVQAGLKRLTPQTITTPEGLRTELARIRHDGVAVDNIENQDGIRCVGAPIFDQGLRPTAAISVSGPTTRVTRDRLPELTDKVRRAAQEISRQLGANVD